MHKIDMMDSMETDVKYQYLLYDFTYEGKKHKGKIRLTEDIHNVFVLYDDHDLEITWFKKIRHKGKSIILNIVLKDDWNDYEILGNVAASVWVCVYNKRRKQIIDEFEPDYWSYLDEECPRNNIDKRSFYLK